MNTQEAMSKKKYKEWSEAELIDTFQLTRLVSVQTPLMQEWLNVATPPFSVGEQFIFDIIYQESVEKIGGWSEEDLKMKFISLLLRLGHLTDDDKFLTFFDKLIAATVEGIPLNTRSDFMVAKGILNLPKKPYFHFQEYKPTKNPTGDSMAQLLEAFLIAQATNQDGKPLYGAEIIGKQWNFVVMEAKSYCIAPSLDCTDKADLLKIIAILRKFRHILETRLLDGLQ